MSRELTEIRAWGGKTVRVVVGPCSHDADEVVPVENTDGEVVAQLCTGCDTQLPAEWGGHA